MAYTYKNSRGVTYYLHSKNVTLRGGGRNQVIYYFKKNAESNTIDDVPNGFRVMESDRTGLPFLKKQK